MVGLVSATAGTHVANTVTIMALNVNDDTKFSNNTATDIDPVVAFAMFASGFE